MKKGLILGQKRFTGQFAKGQLISKWFFDVFDFLQKPNENKYHSSKVEFVRSFFERNVGLKKSFQICLTFSSQ